METVRTRAAISAALTVAFLAALSLSYSADGGQATPGEITAPRSVAWLDARAAFADAICVAVMERGGGKGYSIVVGDRARCLGREAQTALEADADAVLDESQRLLSALFLDPEVMRQVASNPEAELDEFADDTYLSDERVLRILIPRLERRLREDGAACRDCPVIAPVVLRDVSWEAMRPYLEAYLWPDPVRDVPAGDGSEGTEKDYGFHVCAGLNGLAGIPDLDRQLAGAALLLVMTTHAATQRAIEVYGELQRHADLAPLDNDAQTTWLRARLGPQVIAEPGVRQAICATAREHLPELGLRLSGCE